MDDRTREYLVKWAESLIAKIRSNMASEGVNASGQTSQSLTYELKNDGITIYGAPYFAERTEIGRTPTKNRQDFDFASVIAKWIDDKGLRTKFGIEDDRDLRGVSFAIVRNITTIGSAKYRGDIPQTDVFSTAVKDSVDDLEKTISVWFTERALGMIDDVVRDIGQAAGTEKKQLI